jgi:hypothetical protein
MGLLIYRISANVGVSATSHTFILHFRTGYLRRVKSLKTA